MSRFKKYRHTPRGKYTRHKVNAKRRGVAFLLTFEQWWHIWDVSGKWPLRGNRAGMYAMLRIADAGPYSVANVYIARMEVNTCECNRTRHVPLEQRLVQANDAVPF
jgi:hypothetical protein